MKVLLVMVALLFYVSRGVFSYPQQKLTCTNRYSRCYRKKITCPVECPRVKPADPKAKACYLDCSCPTCEAVCRKRKPNCDSPGAACFDPRFVGGDNIVFYFHGKSDEHFSLVSDPNLQINARFIGHRPEGRTRDYTWIQALGIMFRSHTFTLEAKKQVHKWDNEVEHLEFTYDGKKLVIPESHLSEWVSPQKDLKVERTSNKNSVTVTLREFASISVNVVPITKEDDKIHNYKLPSNDCFAHLEVQFKFFNLSPEVDGVLGRTYRPDFENPAKPGVAMPIVGGEDKYRTKSLLSSHCKSCLFAPTRVVDAKENLLVMDYGTLDCSHGANGGNGIVCKK